MLDTDMCFQRYNSLLAFLSLEHFPHHCIQMPKTSWSSHRLLAVSLGSTFHSVFINNLSLRNTKIPNTQHIPQRVHGTTMVFIDTLLTVGGSINIPLDRSYFDSPKAKGLMVLHGTCLRHWDQDTREETAQDRVWVTVLCHLRGRTIRWEGKTKAITV